MLTGKTRNQISNHLVSGRRFESVGSRLQGGSGCLDHPLCHRHPSLYHLDGLHWQFYRLLFVLHLACNVPLEIASAFNELDGHGLRHLYYLFRPDVWAHRHVLFRHGS